MKAFFITNVENSTAYHTGKTNVARTNDFGNFRAKIFEGVKGAAAYSIFEGEGIKFLASRYHTAEFAKSNDLHQYEKQVGCAGCFASHYLLWKRCIELDEIIGIFEYDARQVRVMPKHLEFENLLHLGAWHPIREEDNAVLINGGRGIHDYTGYNRWGFKNVMMGMQSYLLKPHAAKILVEMAKEKGWLPCDRFVSTDIVPMQKQTYSPFIFIQESKQSLTANYPE